MIPLRTKTEYMILVDYDNCTKAQKLAGLYKLIFQIAGWIAQFCDPGQLHILRIRLYGGWYEQSRLTKRAQKLLVDIAQLAPSISIPTGSSGLFKPNIQVELAYSLGARPHKHLFATFRKRSGIGNIRYGSARAQGCANQDCPIEVACSVLSTQRCTSSSCTMRLDKVISRDEQKLVDTMLVSDLIYYSGVRKTATCIVSADDDMWSGIITATAMGGNVYHIKPAPIGDSRSYYTPIQDPHYKQFILS